MNLALIAAVALSLTVISEGATARVRIVVLPRDIAASHGPALAKHLAEMVVALKGGDELFFYTSKPVAQLGHVAMPTDASLNKARTNAALARQFAPVKEHLNIVQPNSVGGMPLNLDLPGTLDEIGRNLIPSLADKQADILLPGSLLYWDARDSRSMAESFIPSDATLNAPRSDWPFSIIDSQKRLAGATLHVCQLNAAADYVSLEHKRRVERFWTLWAVAQSGRIGTMTTDLSSCVRRFTAGEASGQPTYQLSRDGKAEMLRVTARLPADLPASYDKPGEWFLREDVMIAKTPPSTTKGLLWIGVRWTGPSDCDLDIWSRGDATSSWLSYASHRTTDGRFNRDILGGGDGQSFEFIEYTKEVDALKAEAWINVYSCPNSAVPEGVIRAWMHGRVYEQSFRLAGKHSNRGAMPMAGASWLRISIPKLLGIAKE